MLQGFGIIAFLPRILASIVLVELALIVAGFILLIDSLAEKILLKISIPTALLLIVLGLIPLTMQFELISAPIILELVVSPAVLQISLLLYGTYLIVDSIYMSL